MQLLLENMMQQFPRLTKNSQYWTQPVRDWKTSTFISLVLNGEKSKNNKVEEDEDKAASFTVEPGKFTYFSTKEEKTEQCRKYSQTSPVLSISYLLQTSKSLRCAILSTLWLHQILSIRNHSRTLSTSFQMKQIFTYFPLFSSLQEWKNEKSKAIHGKNIKP